MSGQYVIGCDVGSQGTNSALYAADGTLVASAYAGYDVSFPHPGWAEQDPRVWVRALHTTIPSSCDPKESAFTAEAPSGTFSMRRAIVVCSARTQTRGSCSAHPGLGKETS